MVEEQKSHRLGRGLSALLGETEFEASPTETEVSGVRRLPIEYLQPNPFQPRKTFAQEDLSELAASIKERGILQPILVRPYGDSPDTYQIVAGERRWRAAQRASLHDVPVVIQDLDDAETLEVALVENIQRTDLNAIEESAGYQALMDEFGYTQQTLSEVVGKSRSHVANMLRLMSLPASIRSLIEEGKLSAGHGRALLTADEPETLAAQIVREDLNVRQAEALAKNKTQTPKRSATSKPRGAAEKDADTLALEQNLSNSLGLKVSIDHKGDDGGNVVISYKTLEQLDDICRRLGRL